MPVTRSRRADDRLSVLVCRGCCCGTVGKHPDVDHAGHLQRIQRAVAGVRGAKVFTVDCLDQCERSNVVVVRAAGQRRWFGEMLDDGSVAALAEWLCAGGHGSPPTALDAHTFDADARPPGLMTTDLREGADLAAWLDELIAVGGGWMVGVDGAVAEIHAAHTARGDHPVVPLEVTADMRAFVAGRADDPSIPVVIVFAAVTVPVHHVVPELPLGLQIPAGFVVRAIHFPGA